MPKDYSKGKIYKIIVETEEEYKPYIGSTCEQSLARRMSKHRTLYNIWEKEKKNYYSSFELFIKYGVDKCSIVLVESFSCNNNDELRAKEREWYDKIICCNKRKPYLKEGEKKQNKKIYDKKYYENKKKLL